MNDRSLEAGSEPLDSSIGRMSLDQALALVSAEYRASNQRCAKRFISDADGFLVLAGDFELFREAVQLGKPMSANQQAMRIAAHALRFMIDRKIGDAMKLPARLLDKIKARVLQHAARHPDFIIGMPGDDYLRRWFVIPRNNWFNIYLHQFLRSDDDRALHDHPYWNVSLLLEGEYVEHTIPAGGVNIRTLYSAGDVKFRSARAAHRVELTGDPTWSLFITGPRIREWGFHCPLGWRPWQQFTSTKNPGEIGKGCD